MEPKVNLISKYPNGVRYDVINLNKFQAIFFGVFLVPIRLFSALTILTVLYVITFCVRVIYGGKKNSLNFTVKFHNNQIPRGKLYMELVYASTPPFLIRLFMFCLGVTKITHKKHSIYDFLADYKPVLKDQTPGIVISNHATWTDVLYLVSKKMAFLTKEFLGKSYPLEVSQSRDSVFF